MASIADFFFLAGLGNDYEFDTDCSSRDEVSRAQTSAGVGKTAAKTANDRASSLRRRASLKVKAEPKSLQENNTCENARPEPSCETSSESHGITPPPARTPEDPFGFRTDTFSLRALVDPLQHNRRSIKSIVEEDDNITGVHESGARSAEEQDQFDDSTAPKFSSGRRDLHGLMRRLSNSSTLSIGRRDSRGKSTSGLSGTRRSTASTKATSARPISQAYSHVIADPEPLLLPAGTHPLKRKYAPRLLAKYPDTRLDAQSTSPFPAYVPMFSFPDDIMIRPGDDRPRSSWHGFSLTQGDGRLIYGMCIILWIPLRDEIADRIETRCAEWRQKHMPAEEREMSLSFSTKLATERARLSELLRVLNEASAREREAVNEKINDCEEKIAVYTELLKPIRHGTSSNIAGLTKSCGMWMPRALGILGTDVNSQSTWKSWLITIAASYMRTELRNVPTATERTDPFLPLERYVVNLCHEIPRPPSAKFKVEAWICNARIDTVQEAQNELPGCRNVDLFPLFRTLTIENIVLLFEAALQESRIILMSTHSAMLSSVSAALTSVLYPFHWQGVYIPVLPRRLISCLDAPVPFIMGIQKQFTNIDLPEGDDVVVCDLDQNIVLHEMSTTLPIHIRKKLRYCLSIASPMHRTFKVPYGPPTYCVESFPANSVVRIATSDPSTTPCLTDLLVQSSDACIDTDYSVIKKPDHNMFSTRVWETKLNRIMPDVKTTQTTGAHSVRPRLRSHFSLASSLRSRENLEKRASIVQDYTDSRLSIGGRPSIISRRMTNVPPPNKLTTSASMSSIADSIYAHSYSQQSAAASTILGVDTVAAQLASAKIPQAFDAGVILREGHEMQYHKSTDKIKIAPLCDYAAEVIDGGFYICLACKLTISEKHIHCISLPCLPRAFDSNKARAAFVRSLASLLSNYRKFLVPSFNAPISYDRAAHERECVSTGNNFLRLMLDTQLFANFIEDRCAKTQSDPEIKLFDQILLAKRKRSKSTVFFGGRSELSFLLDRSATIKRTFTAMPPDAENLPTKDGRGTDEVPDYLDHRLLSEPRTLVAENAEDRPRS